MSTEKKIYAVIANMEVLSPMTGITDKNYLSVRCQNCGAEYRITFRSLKRRLKNNLDKCMKCTNKGKAKPERPPKIEETPATSISLKEHFKGGRQMWIGGKLTKEIPSNIVADLSNTKQLIQHRNQRKRDLRFNVLDKNTIHNYSDEQLWLWAESRPWT